jgi:NAD(P)-dependent dehydrogenase (short-subunit alcohol dehydrogenase family)
LPLTVSSYDYAAFTDAFKKIRAEWPDSPIRVAVFNAGDGVWKPFLDVDEADVRKSLDSGVVGAFGFSREAILAFKELADTEEGKKGTLIFTGATAALRGNKTTSAFAAAKFGLRALSQSLAKEFGPQGIHVAHVSVLYERPPLLRTDRFAGCHRWRHPHRSLHESSWIAARAGQHRQGMLVCL